jgi:FKBP-type peptidyl-prolyl cis-trans isomerase
VGDFVEMHIQQIYGENDSVLMETRKVNNNQPVSIQLRPASFDGDIPEGFTYMSEGDSAVFLISVDTLLSKIPSMPPFFHKGNFLEFHVVMVSIKSEEQMKKDQAEKAAKQNEVDDKMLKEYFEKNKLQPTKTASGLYYIIHTPGTGANAKPGDQVSMKYTGKLMDGTPFDSNIDSNFHHVEPFKFTLGQGQVIRGWDEGIALLNKGSKATLYIPSSMAYGDKSPAPMIPANSILVFDVELVSIGADNATEQPTTAPKAAPAKKPAPTKKK